MVEVRYEERRAGRAIAQRLERWLSLPRGRTSPGRSSSRPAWTRALGFAVLILVVAVGILFYTQSQRSEPKPIVKEDVPVQEQDTRPDPPDVAPREAVTRADQSQPSSTKRRHKRVPNDVLAERNPGEGADNPTRPAQPDLTSDPADATRSTTQPLTGATLPQVKLIRIEVLGDDSLARQIKDALGAVILSRNRFAVTDRRESADALLKVFARSARAGRPPSGPFFIVRLVNARGYVIWPMTREGSGKKYEGAVVDSASRIVSDLLEAAGESSRQWAAGSRHHNNQAVALLERQQWMRRLPVDCRNNVETGN